jgi:hypothetical protein
MFYQITIYAKHSRLITQNKHILEDKRIGTTLMHHNVKHRVAHLAHRLQRRRKMTEK